MNASITNTANTDNADKNTTFLNSPYDKEERIRRITATLANMVCPFTKSHADIGVCDVDISLLSIDTSYQRTPANIRKLYKAWDPKIISPIVLSNRNGELYIVDGAKRVLCAAEKNIQYLPAIIYFELTQTEEAKMFLNQAGGIRHLTGFESFKANLSIGEQTDTTIQCICDKYGVKVVRSPKDSNGPNLTNITKARDIIKTSGENGLDWILKTLKAAYWLEYSNGASGKYLQALHSVYKYGQDSGLIGICEENLANTLRQVHPNQFYGTAVAKYPHMEVRMAIDNLMMDVAKGKTTAQTILKR